MTEQPNEPIDNPQPDAQEAQLPEPAGTIFSNNAYNKLKQVAQIWLPALAVFYITVAPFWGLPKQEEVAGTIMALDLLLGAVLGLANRQYQNSDARFDGTIDMSTGAVKLSSSAINAKNEIVVKVDKS